MNKYYLSLDLIDDAKSISSYEEWHKNTWPEVKKSIFDSGIVAMEIFRTGNRLLMVIEAEDGFSFENKAKMDASNPKVLEWEALMDQYQQRLPWAKEGEKWTLMKRIFHLSKTKHSIQE
ncbi:L-rhamnose mutarotase [Belliella marina]|uniref:L-rhamnose mutarotase n=1 Tax=Belliella marina TaxID=1644146 RepID=A0ABW4VIQ9_9BACT